MKRIFILSLILPFTLTLSACGKSDEQKKETCIKKIENLSARPDPKLFKNLREDSICKNVTGADIEAFNKTHPRQKKQKVSDTILSHPDPDTIHDHPAPMQQF